MDLVGPSTGDELVAECRGLLGKNLNILYQLVNLDPSDPEEWGSKMQKRADAGLADAKTQKVMEKIQMIAESIIDNGQYAGQENKRYLCREVSIAVFTELIWTLAPVVEVEENEQRCRQEETSKKRRAKINYIFTSMLDSQETMEILDGMHKEENAIWETLIEKTKVVASWIGCAEKSDNGEPLFTVMQMITKMLIEESKWLQT